MKPKARPKSKIPTTQTNTNQKKKASSKTGMGVDASLLKKNEFTMIMVGALAATVLVFFLFFRTSGSDSNDTKKSGSLNQAAAMDQGLEKRISELEVALARISSSSAAEDDAADDETASGKNAAEIEQRIKRLETAMTLKVDALIERLGKLEKQVLALRKKSAPSPVVKVSKSTSAPAVKTPVKTKSAQVAKTSAKQKSMFHTVKKGETLWSISQKYKTTVPAIRKLNNLTPKDEIYPGNNLLVR